MSMQIFEESGVFDPTFWNLKIGDILQIIAVGGGGGGAAEVYDSSLAVTFPGGDAGKTPRNSDGFVSYLAGGGGGYILGCNTRGNGGHGGLYETPAAKLIKLPQDGSITGGGGGGDSDLLNTNAYSMYTGPISKGGSIAGGGSGQDGGPGHGVVVVTW